MFRQKSRFRGFVRDLKIKSWKIDGIEIPRKESIARELVPHFQNVSLSSSDTAYLRWMNQKDVLHQDMFLIGHPTENKRNLAFLYSFLTNSEIEYISITKDTTEHDFKQRREIQDGNAYYIDQAAVGAALSGRILIIDGIEKAEQNILPVINNLLENREMTLEDGRTLLSHVRYQELLETHTQAELENLKIFQVHQNFRVIAIGLPIPPYPGNTLDPPLRSRFQALKVAPNSFEHLLSFPWKISNDFLLKTIKFANIVQLMPSAPYLAFENLFHLLKIVEKWESVLTLEMVRKLFDSAYPLVHLAKNNLVAPEIQKLLSTTIENFGFPSGEVKFDKMDWNHEDSSLEFVISSGDRTSNITIVSNKPVSTNFDHLTSFQNGILLSMIQTHSIDRDICLIGEKATGKSIVCEAFGNLFGYNLSLFPMFSEITTRDLFQKRTTDDKGNTKWTNSILLDAMIHGGLCVLDGIDKISSDILLALQTLIQNRSLYLFDGTRYVSPECYEDLSKEFTSDQLHARRIFRIHPKFRLICVGSIKKDSHWLNSEVLCLFNMLFLNPLTFQQKYDLLSKFSSNQKLVKNLIEFQQEYNQQYASSKEITIRDLKRILLRLQKFPNESIVENLQKCSMSFLSKTQKSEFTKLCEKFGLNDKQGSSPVNLTISDDFVQMDEIRVDVQKPKNLALVPNPYFVSMKQHETLLKELLQDHILGHHSLLMGNQGVGKNKVVDYFLSILKREREYLQLHRDTTINSLTVQPNVTGGILEFIDSPLVKAVKFGRILVLDEADKAPVEVVSIIKSLLEDGEMILADHRKITKKLERDTDIAIHPNFRVILLANRPGYPFHGNDFFRECGDIFSPHFLSNPDPTNEVHLLSSVGPSVPRELLETLSLAFNDLRLLQEDGTCLYPYSTREIVNIVRHLEKFPSDGVTRALENVFAFDSFDSGSLQMLKRVFSSHGIPLSYQDGEYKISLSVLQTYTLFKSKKLDLGPIQPVKFEHVEFKVRRIQFETGFSTQTENTNVVNHRLEKFTELQFSIPFVSPVTHLEVVRDKIVTFNARTHKLNEYSPDYQTYKSIDLYHTLRVLHECSKLEVSSFGDFMVFWGRSKNGMVQMVYLDVITNGVKSFYLEFPVKSIDGIKLDLVNTYSRSEDLFYLRSDTNVYQIHLASGNVVVRRLSIENNGVSWISPTQFSVHQRSTTTIVTNVKSNYQAQSMDITSSFNSKLITKTTRQEVMVTRSGEQMQHVEFEDGVCVVSSMDLPPDVVSDSSTMSADLAKQVLSFGRGLVVFDPIAQHYRNIPQEEPILAIRELYNGSIVVHSKSKIQILQIDLHQLNDQSKYWTKYIKPSSDAPKFTIEFEKEFNEPNKPKHGQDDDEEHFGGNTYAGGTGGRDTAGLGGYGGPYRLDKGFHIHQVPETLKKQVRQETHEAAKKIAQDAYKKRLEQIDMSETDMTLYMKFYRNVEHYITQLREIFSSSNAKEKERSWVKNLTNGELDENKIIEGIIGEKLIYKKRDSIEQKNQKKPKLIHFLFDVSASMYRFNSQDQRLNRELEISLLVMQSLKNFEYKYKYRMYGHSGENSMYPFITDQAPKNEKEELKILLKMHAHTQFCQSGDTTVEAIERSVDAMAKDGSYDEKILFVFSDANLTRYGISGDDMRRVILKNKDVQVYVIFIASFADEAEMIKAELPNTYLCFDTKSLVQTYSEILKTKLLR